MNEDIRFWLTVAGATFLKIATSPSQSPTRALIAVSAAVFSAWAFTDPVVDWMKLDPENYRNAVAALLALMGEGLMRWLVGITPERFIEIWRGRK